MAVLPQLDFRQSPNQSARTDVPAPWLIVVHRPVGSYAGTVDWLRNPASRASAHVVTESFDRATQLVPWNRKAWTCAAFNSASYNVEVDDNAWDGLNPRACDTAARIVAYLCQRTGIPPTWTRQPTHTPGVCRHFDLGRAGGGHTDPTTDETLWRGFVEMVRREHERGGFRPTWGVGTFARIDT